MFMWHVGDIAEKKKCKTGQHEKWQYLTRATQTVTVLYTVPYFLNLGKK